MRIVLWTAVVLLGGLWGWLGRQNAVDEARLAAQVVENPQAFAPVRTVSATRTPVNSAGVAAAPAGAGRETLPNIRRLRVNTFFQNPDREALYLKTRKAALAAVYGPFMRARGLTAAQTATLEDLLVRREAQMLDIVGTNPDATRRIALWGEDGPDPFTLAVPRLTAALTAASGPDDPAVALLNKNDQEFVADATALLGADGFQAWQNYYRALPLQPIVTSLAGSLAASPTPLTVDQAQQLTDLLASASSSYQRGRPASATQLDWGTVLARAPQFLSADQLSALENDNAVVIQGPRFTRAVDVVRAASSP